jgi:transposase
VTAVRRGAGLRAVARTFGVSLSMVQRWYRRAQGQRLDRAEFADRSSRPFRTTRTSVALEETIVRRRRELQEQSDLGLVGAAVIHRVLSQAGHRNVPSVRTIGRILERHGVLEGRHRVRRPPPPLGWYLPEVARRDAELDSLDIVEGLVIRGGPHIEVLNVVSLHGGLPQSWPIRSPVSAKYTFRALLQHWRAVGLPHFAQFDNDTIFQGAHQHPDSFGRVTRLCLALGITPVFAPPREPGFQAAIESYNGLWQRTVWRRFDHPTVHTLQLRSALFVAALRRHRHLRVEGAPPRRPFPSHCPISLQAPLQGRVIYLRRTTAAGVVEVLGHQFPLGAAWPHRLVRCEVLLSRQRIRCFALRRRAHHLQPLLAEFPYEPPTRPFRE